MVIGTCSCLVLLILAVKLQQHANGSDKISSFDDDATSTSSTSSTAWTGDADSARWTLEVVASNEYSRTVGPAAQQYPWVRNRTVLEPYKDSRFDLGGTLADQDGLTFTLSVGLIDARDEGGPSAETFDISAGNPVTATLKAVGKYQITVEATSDGVAVKSVSLEVLCRYVRRELRDLTVDDRNRLFKSMEVLYRVPTASGRLLYGDGYSSAAEFVRIHNELAGQRDCDHMHDGLGFLTLHTALTMQFEQVLQLVDPSVVMHFWDYTIDSERYYRAGGQDIGVFYKSEVFRPDWFGTVVQEDNTVSEGRFAYVSVAPEDFQITARTLNAFGLLRSPWNANPTPFLTRANTTYGALQSNPPGCEWHFGQMSLTTWSEFGVDVQYRPHGKIHTLIAGVWGAEWVPKFKAHNYVAYNNGEALALNAFGYQKDMWRAGLLECPTSCSADAPAESCKCTCGNLDKWIEDEAGPLILSHVQMVDEDKIDNADGEDMSPLFMRLLCNDFNDTAPQIGDLMNSGAPADPIFWPIHPTVERLWQWRRINGMSNHSWPPSTQNYVHGNDGGCAGHDKSDVTVFKNLFDQDDSFYTNGQLYDLMDPNLEDTGSNAVFADFRWGHCQDLGYPIDLLASKFVAKDEKRFTGSPKNDCEKDEPYHEGKC